MESRRFIIADVFTSKRFGGNQLAVFPEATGLDQETMQDLAREMHFSETTFLFPPESGGDFKIKIFTPDRELPFAGHPIVGTAHVIVAEGLKLSSEIVTRLTLEATVGPISVEVSTENGRAGHTTMNQPLPVVKGSFGDLKRLAGALSIDAAEIEKTGLPVEAIDNGITVMIVPVVSLASVEKIRVDVGRLEEISNEMGAVTVLAFTRETVEQASTVHCRVFAPAAGVVEDAATGSANGPLGFYLVRHGVAAAEAVTKIISEQGYEMKRPSMLHIEVEVDPQTNDVAAVRVGGGVVITGRGEMIIKE